jgi:hypothetical protein
MPETETPTREDPGEIEDPGAIFQHDGPINPAFFREAVRTLLCALPLMDPNELQAVGTNRMHAALIALAMLRPRDEIELMLGVQALAAYHAAAACWRLGMNLTHPRGNSIRHFTTATTAARTFDTLLKTLERRQAKHLPPAGERPAPRHWAPSHPAAFMQLWETRCQAQDADTPDPQVVWTPDAVAKANDFIDRERIADENKGLDIAGTEGIRPDGSIIMPEFPTPQQAAYVARRLTLRIKREWAENQRNGIRQYPKIRPLRTGDLVE